jgi:hypothetical protein
MRIVLVLSLAAIGAVVGELIAAQQPGHQPWPLVGLVVGGLLGWWLAATQLPRRRRSPPRAAFAAPPSLFDEDPPVDVDREVTVRLECEHDDPEARSGYQRSGRCQGAGGAAVHGAYTGTARSLHSSTRHPRPFYGVPCL